VTDPYRDPYGVLMPDPIVPVPALAWPDIRGARVIVGSARSGWRADLRADAPVEQNNRVFIPVLTEHDWYRAEAEQTEVFAPLVSIERVWVEIATPQRMGGTESPGVRDPLPAEDAPSVLGRRVVRVDDGPAPAYHRDLRAVSEVRLPAGGRAELLVVDELEWYRWTWTGRIPKATKVPADRIWVE
jgi:hypothetical protein